MPSIMRNKGVSKLTEPDNTGGYSLSKEGLPQKLQQATMGILTNLAETDNLPWTVQMVLLSIISTTGVQAGAIRLKDGDDYTFAAQEDIANFEKNISLDCHLDRKSRLLSISDHDLTFPCMFSWGPGWSGSFVCTDISAWYKTNAESLLEHKLWCKKCIRLGYETAVMVPIKTAGEILGLIHLYDSRKEAISADEVVFLETISSPLGYALKHLQDRESVRRSEEQFRFLAENARDIIFRLQIFPERKFIYVSPASTFISGYDPAEFYADQMFDKKLVHPADYPEFKACISGGADFSRPIILRFICKDGRVIWVELLCAPIYNKDRVEIIEGIARDVTERIRADHELKSSYEQLKTFSSTILRMQEEEKIRLSRELHDEVGQALTAVKIDLQVIRKELEVKGFGFQERMSEGINLVDSTLERVRKQAVSLRPPALDHMGLVAAVQNMVQGFSRRTDIEVKVIAGEEISRFPTEVETALFRCIQEALTNVARHSAAKRVIIEFRPLPGSLQVRVEDNGRGFEPEGPNAPTGRLGLTGMRERVKLLNGNFKIESKPGRGTRITITIPLI